MLFWSVSQSLFHLISMPSDEKSAAGGRKQDCVKYINEIRSPGANACVRSSEPVSNFRHQKAANINLIILRKSYSNNKSISTHLQGVQLRLHPISYSNTNKYVMLTRPLRDGFTQLLPPQRRQLWTCWKDNLP